MTTFFNSVLACATATIFALPLPALADPSHGHGHVKSTSGFAAGEPGDTRLARTITITMRETMDGKMIYQPARIEVRRGENIRFVLTNAGDIPHEFMLATVEENRKHAVEMAKDAGMAHHEPNGRMLDAKKKGELVWRFTKVGTFEYACLIPGHLEAGMRGTVTVR